MRTNPAPMRPQPMIITGKRVLNISLASSARSHKANSVGKSEISVSIGQYLRNKALIAIVISMVCIAVYIAWRFQFIFGVGAAIARFHDVPAVLGIFWLLDKEITLLVVTALFTLAGYSLTDTVVVFDRIRENMRARRRSNLGEVIYLSVNEVLSRTIITSGTVFPVVFALYLFGGVVLHDFALAMMLGVFVSVYSSILVANPLVFAWRREARTSTLSCSTPGLPSPNYSQVAAATTTSLLFHHTIQPRVKKVLTITRISIQSPWGRPKGQQTERSSLPPPSYESPQKHRYYPFEL